MFIRKTRKTAPDTKKAYFSFQLVESVRTERGPRQRILLNLGADLDLDPKECKLLADRIEMIVTGQKELVLPPQKIEVLAQRYASKLIKNLSVPIEKTESTDSVPDLQTVDLTTLVHKEARTVGAEHLLLTTAKTLKLPDYLKHLGFSASEVALSLGIIIARATYPASERATFSWLQCQSGLGELLDFDFQTVPLKKLYQISDRLLKHKQGIEDFLAREQRMLHGITSTIILYDLTNTYMEGQAKAKHGRSKEKRSDSPLITLGLVVDEYGFPVRSKFLEGNVSEPKTLQQAVEALRQDEDLFKPTIVLDAGISSEENLQWLKENGFTYIVSARQKPPTQDVEEEYCLVGNDQQVKVAHLKVEETKDRWLLCHSPAKEATASQMKTLFQQRFEEDLIKLQDNLSKPRGRKKYDKVLQRIGRLKEKHRQISGCYKVTVTSSADKKTAIAVGWEVLSEKLSERLIGEYYLRTNLTNKRAGELWNIYNTLRKIEDSFRFMKSDLGMRPVYHQKEKRVDGHLWITILAYYLIQDITYQLKENGVRDSWKTIRTQMSNRIRVTTQMNTDKKKTVHVRSTTKPERPQLRLYNALGLSTNILGSKKTIL